MISGRSPATGRPHRVEWPADAGGVERTHPWCLVTLTRECAASRALDAERAAGRTFGVTDPTPDPLSLAVAYPPPPRRGIRRSTARTPRRDPPAHTAGPPRRDRRPARAIPPCGS